MKFKKRKVVLQIGNCVKRKFIKMISDDELCGKEKNSKKLSFDEVKYQYLAACCGNLKFSLIKKKLKLSAKL